MDLDQHVGDARPPAPATIPRVAVASSNIAEVGYDPASETLEVAFGGGGVYRYAGVPPEVHAALLAADSKGAHFGRHIKPRYACTRMLPQPEGGA